MTPCYDAVHGTELTMLGDQSEEIVEMWLCYFAGDGEVDC